MGCFIFSGSFLGAIIDAIQSQKGKAEICSEYKIPATNLYDWKDKAIRDLYQLFIPESEYTKKQKLSEQEIEKLHKIIGEISIENNFLKKKLPEINYEERKNMLEICADISIRRQAELLNIPRTKLYYKPVISDESEIANLIREIYLLSDCRYGYRKITADLHNQGKIINAKKVLRIMQEMEIEGLYPKSYRNTTIKNPEHKIYPYLLSGIEINRINQVWASDITYIKINGKFMYFTAIIDLHSRYIIGYDLSYSLEAGFCIALLERALATRVPEIFNTDQGSQYTSSEFIQKLQLKNVSISMDHVGRCFDNIYVERLWRTLKQEVIYYYRPDDIGSLEKRIEEFVPWYNNKRLHQALKYRTPASIYLS
ncbi:IS3 family transposase [Candidatus Lariskella endosymbiont of Epinotia ramella]|uniref:IS3 family transposase n=1 Tax=Candidatus Lariskella endosymbiont of Epinotia ramella TaxID=3066224 RepID=UPI0030CFBF3D